MPLSLNFPRCAKSLSSFPKKCQVLHPALTSGQQLLPLTGSYVTGASSKSRQGKERKERQKLYLLSKSQILTNLLNIFYSLFLVYEGRGHVLCMLCSLPHAQALPQNWIVSIGWQNNISTVKKTHTAFRWNSFQHKMSTFLFCRMGTVPTSQGCFAESMRYVKVK